VRSRADACLAYTGYVSSLKWLREAVPKQGAASFLEKPLLLGQNIVIVRLKDI
jgi:hypothetical protein